MSLISFIKSKPIAEKFSQTFSMPRFDLDGQIIAPPKTKNYSLVGTAFDYLLRFHIKQILPESIDSKWVAESSVDRIKIYSGSHARVDGHLKPFNPDKDSREQFPNAKDIVRGQVTKSMEQAIKPAEKIVSDAKTRYAKFLQTGKLEDDLIESTLKLAQLDLMTRIGHLVINDGVSKDDIDDLRSLFDVAIKSGIFKRGQKVILNPNFGKGSHLVGGADADLIVDDTLIDIKVVKNLKLERKYYDQIIGYYALSTVEGKPTSIKNIGIYFARHGVLWTIPIENIGKKEDFEKVISWFEDHDKQLRGKRYAKTK